MERVSRKPSARYSTEILPSLRRLVSGLVVLGLEVLADRADEVDVEDHLDRLAGLGLGAGRRTSAGGGCGGAAGMSATSTVAGSIFATSVLASSVTPPWTLPLAGVGPWSATGALFCMVGGHHKGHHRNDGHDGDNNAPADQQLVALVLLQLRFADLTGFLAGLGSSLCLGLDGVRLRGSLVPRVDRHRWDHWVATSSF